MILAGGKQYESSLQSRLLATLEDRLNATLAGPGLEAETVIAAIDRLGRKVEAGVFDKQIAALQIDGAEQYKQMAVRLLRRDHLEFKLRTELGAEFCPDYVTQPPAGLKPLRVMARPLGVLLHIAAGNADGLPAFSVAEGLITGNINILKLPQADNGLSLEILQTLLEIEPGLADYLYVFDTPSSDLGAIKKMADLSDGIVVWGGETAVSAVRRFAHPGTRLIEWGHRLSFAYLAGRRPQAELEGLAKHIVETRQLLCSSCQVIYLDTEDFRTVQGFCARFWPILEQAAKAHRPGSIGAVAELSLRSYTDRLEAILKGDRQQPWTSPLCSLIPKEDSGLELSPMFANVLVKPLPRDRIIPVLRKAKPYLQTAGLGCEADERESLVNLLIRAGLTRVTAPGSMSESLPGEAHDGAYPLQRYLRIVNVE
ncbi:MAG: acyl-CoA reductase [Oscillospiraceae bacterium]|nr:acyl-CoA reductase [Oscillospiraceae bacterium]